MDWTFWLGLVGIVVLWLLIRWANTAWRRHAERVHGRRLDDVAATEASVATDVTEASDAADATDATRRIDGTATGTGGTQPEHPGPRQGFDPPNR